MNTIDSKFLSSVHKIIPMMIVCIYDHNHCIKYANSKFVKTIDHALSDIVETNIFDYISNHDYIRFADALEKFSREKESIEIELTLKDQKGSSIDTIVYLAKDEVNEGVTHLFCINNRKQKLKNKYLDVYKQIFSSSRELTALVGTDMKYILVNDAYPDHFGMTLDQIINHHISVVHGSKSPDVIEKLKHVLDTGEQIHYQTQINTSSPEAHYIDGQLSPYYGENGVIEGVIVTSRNVTAFKKEELALQKDKHYYKTLFNHSPDLLASVHLHSGRIIECNRTLEKILGYEKGELTNKLIFDFHLEKNNKDLVLAIAKLKYGEMINGLELTLKSKSDELVDAHLRTTPVVEIGDDVAIFVWRDIRHQKKLAYKASHDPLTRVLNRAGFIDVLKQPSNNNKVKSLVYIDVDNFKTLNDKFGHLKGDKFLVDIARIIKNNLRKDDNVCRVGGDEFVLLIQNIGINQVEITMQNILNSLNEFIDATPAYKESKLGLSIGITQLHPDEPLELCVQRADNACYESKQKGKNQISVFDYNKTISSAKTKNKMQDVSIEELI